MSSTISTKSFEDTFRSAISKLSNVVVIPNQRRKTFSVFSAVVNKNILFYGMQYPSSFEQLEIVNAKKTDMISLFSNQSILSQLAALNRNIEIIIYIKPNLGPLDDIALPQGFYFDKEPIGTVCVLSSFKYGFTKFKIRYDYHHYDGMNKVTQTTVEFNAMSTDTLRAIADSALNKFPAEYAAFPVFAVGCITEDTQDIEEIIYDDDELLASVYRHDFILVLSNISTRSDIL